MWSVEMGYVKIRSVEIGSKMGSVTMLSEKTQVCFVTIRSVT